MYSLHLVHVGGRASVATPQGVVCAALSRHMAGGSYAREPLYGGLSRTQLVPFPPPYSMVLLRPSNYFRPRDTRLILMSGRVRLAGLDCILNTI